MSVETCPGCKKELGERRRDGSTIGDEARHLNAMPLMTGMGGTAFICIPCAQNACRLARELYVYAPVKHLYFPTLLTRDPVDGDPTRKFVDS